MRVPETKNLDKAVLLAINNKVWCFRYNPFTGVADMPWTPYIGIGKQLQYRVTYTLCHVLRGGRIFPGDVFLSLDEIR